jgi:lipopolysaccharide/colanic/teichoic acid biosynthesis glycosyltransferase/peptidoglycan/LPS O-acetylase OafA/YrhL
MYVSPGARKRALDLMLASIALALLWPFIAAAAMLVMVSSPGAPFYKAVRVGRSGRLFSMLKLRTMHAGAAGSRLTSPDDQRVTRIGRILRVLKVDELPQLVNVIRGDMSIVGPRPEDPRLVGRYPAGAMSQLLTVKPGLTSPGTLFETTNPLVLEGPEDMETAYASRMLPAKTKLDIAYLQTPSALWDLKLIARTAVTLAELPLRRRYRNSAGEKPDSLTGKGLASGNGSFAPGLGALRGLAALGVVISHVLLVLPVAEIDGAEYQPLDLLNGPLSAQHVILGIFNGRALVTLFFVLSGCVLTISLSKNGYFGLRTLPGYWIKRGFRLYPMLIAAATLGAMLQIVVSDSVVDQASSWVNSHYKIQRVDIFQEWFSNIIGRSSSLNGPAWSTKVELVASFVFPIFFLATRTHGGAIISILLASAAMFAYEGEGTAHLHLFSLAFILGTLLPRYANEAVKSYNRSGKIIKASTACIVLLMFMFGRRIINPDLEGITPAVILVETMSSAAIVGFFLVSPPRRLATSRAIQWLGRISYGIYLLHLIVLLALVHFLLPFLSMGGVPEAVAVTLLLLAVTLAITVPLSAFLYHCLEMPAQRIGRRAARCCDGVLRPRRREMGEAQVSRR